MAKQVPRILRADDFVAEAYEKWAANLPASEKERAAYYLRTAKMFRESGRTGMVRVWEEEKVEFVGAESLGGRSATARKDLGKITAGPRITTNKKGAGDQVSSSLAELILWTVYERLRRRNGTPARPKPRSSMEVGSGVVVGGPTPTSLEIAKSPSP